jgi:hypothetical protein
LATLLAQRLSQPSDLDFWRARQDSNLQPSDP